MAFFIPKRSSKIIEKSKHFSSRSVAIAIISPFGSLHRAAAADFRFGGKELKHIFIDRENPDWGPANTIRENTIAYHWIDASFSWGKFLLFCTQTHTRSCAFGVRYANNGNTSTRKFFALLCSKINAFELCCTQDFSFSFFLLSRYASLNTLMKLSLAFFLRFRRRALFWL